MFKKLPVFYLLVFVLACNPDKNREADLKEIRFSTTDASELFFKNMRKSNYDLEENRQAGMDLYTLEQLTKSGLPLKPIIIISWRTDMAFFHFENQTDEEVLIILAGADTISFDGTNQKQHALLAASMYNAILKDIPLAYLEDGNRKDFFTSARQAESFRIMFFDFLRLVELR